MSETPEVIEDTDDVVTDEDPESSLLTPLNVTPDSEEDTNDSEESDDIETETVIESDPAASDEIDGGETSEE